MGDFDGDGKDDLFLQPRTAYLPVGTLLANFYGIFTQVNQRWLPGEMSSYWDDGRSEIAVGDLNGDGRDDLAVRTFPSVARDREPVLAIYLMGEDGRIDGPSQLLGDRQLGDDWTREGMSLFARDIDGDGRAELLLQRPDGSGLAYAANPRGHLAPRGRELSVAEMAEALEGPQRARLEDVVETGMPVGGVGTAGPDTQGGISRLSVARDDGQVTAQTVGIPAVGALEMSHGVSGGASSFTIPIAVPPGKVGLAPDVSLTYNSRQGNGLVGVGWSIGGQSMIHRCPSTWAQDGMTNGVDFDANDRFCLDGQRLMVMQGDTYGASGAEYRTEIDQFS